MFAPSSKWPGMEFLSVDLFKRFLVSRDGYNLAFIFNSSLGQEGGACRQGLDCLVEELVQVGQGN